LLVWIEWCSHVIAMSGKAVEAAVTWMCWLLDKTGTITLAIVRRLRSFRLMG